MTLAEELDSLLPPESTLTFGELLLSRSAEGTFLLQHRKDASMTGDLQLVTDTPSLRDLGKFCAEGNYRPLRTAPGLKTGWKAEAGSAAECLEKIDAIYPGAFATWIGYERGDYPAIPLRETLDRQTGMYRFASSITDQMANRIMRETCSKGCLRLIAWPIDGDCAVGEIRSRPGSIPLICTEACTFAVSEARKLAREAYDKANAPG